MIYLVNKKTGVAVDSVGSVSKESDAVNEMLRRHGLIFLNGKVLSLATLPFSPTDLILSKKKPAGISRNQLSGPHAERLRDLAEKLAGYRESKNKSASGPRSGRLQDVLVPHMVVTMHEAEVRGTIEECRKSGVPEAEILILLGDDSLLARGGTTAELQVTSRP